MIGVAHFLALKSQHLGPRHRGSEERILTRAFHHPSPARISGDIYHGSERPLDSRGASLLSRDRLGAFDHFRIPGRGHGDRRRENRVVAMNHVQPEQHRDVQARLFHGHVLQPVDLFGIRYPQDGTGSDFL